MLVAGHQYFRISSSHIQYSIDSVTIIIAKEYRETFSSLLNIGNFKGSGTTGPCCRMHGLLLIKSANLLSNYLCCITDHDGAK